MIKRNSTFFLGIFIFLIPFLGLPSFWKTTFIILSGVTLVGLSVKLTLPRKAPKGRLKREKITPVFVENSPIIKSSPPPPQAPEPLPLAPEVRTQQAPSTSKNNPRRSSRMTDIK